MQQYLDMIEHVLSHGLVKENRTGVDTLSVFNYNYKVDISEKFPLLTTKDMSGGVWNSLVRELEWYLSGTHHIKEFSKHSKIWNAWADEDMNLETAYGRFWRQYPVPDVHERMPGEAWAIGDNDAMQKFVREIKAPEQDRHILVFDQIAYIVDLLLNDPMSRRMVLLAWHPANAGVSKLPPCHYTACFNVSGDGKLNCHLTQRSGDLGLGVPFNIACYSALTYVIAKATGLEPGHFAHTIVDLHVYCGDGIDDPYSHVPALREQLTREPRELPTLTIKGEPEDGHELDWIDSLGHSDFSLKGYDNPHPRLRMKVAV